MTKKKNNKTKNTIYKKITLNIPDACIYLINQILVLSHISVFHFIARYRCLGINYHFFTNVYMQFGACCVFPWKRVLVVVELTTIIYSPIIIRLPFCPIRITDYTVVRYPRPQPFFYQVIRSYPYGITINPQKKTSNKTCTIQY